MLCCVVQNEEAAQQERLERLLAAYNEITLLLSQQFVAWDEMLVDAEARVRRSLPGDEE